MAIYTNPLRKLLRRGQFSNRSTPDLIAGFDGTSDSRVQDHPMFPATSSQQDNNDGSATLTDLPPSLPGQRSAVGQQYTYQQTAPPPQYLAVQQGGEGRDCMGNMAEELGQMRQDNSDELTLLTASHTATAQEVPFPLPYIDDHSRTVQLQDSAMLTDLEAQVKQGPAAHEHDDHDIFAEFTNEGLHDDAAQISKETQQASRFTEHPVSSPVSVKQEPGLESKLLANVSECTEKIESTNVAGRNVLDTSAARPSQPPQGLALGTPQPYLDGSVSSSKPFSESKYLQSQVLSSRNTLADGSQRQYSFERCAQAPQQSLTGFPTQLGNSMVAQTASVESVTDSQRHSSEDTVSSPDGMDLSANTELLAQQWQQRQSYFGDLTADAVHANLVSLRGPSHAENHSDLQLVPAFKPPQGPSVHQQSPTHGQKRSSTIHSPQATQYGQLPLSWKTPGWSFGSILPQASPSHPSSTQGLSRQSLVSPGRITEVQDKDTSRVSADDEPLATRSPRYRSTTVSPTIANSLLSVNSNSGLKPSTSTPKSYLSNDKQNSVIELSDDDGEVAAESMSWKLPDFEVTYHPPATANDLPMAKVSTLGSGISNNLVRSEVALTEDHAHHEMELFLNVFLPAQRGLQTPDPEPAHAVINFHTISVMVLEAFVQYEIGDEMGRGYGFHGGNVGNHALRPNSSSDGEPLRTRSAQEADADEIFFAVIDRWRAGLLSGKGTLGLIRGCQEFCDIALDVIYYVREHGLSQPEPKQRKERSDKGVRRGPKGNTKEPETKGKTAGKRKANSGGGRTSAKKIKVNEPPTRKKAKSEVKKTPGKTKPKAMSSSVTATRK